MSIQKQKLTQFASALQTQLATLQTLRQEKSQYSKKIGYKISSLFALLSSYPMISSRELSQLFDPLQVRLLIQNKKYLTVQDLCRYLGVSEKSQGEGPTLRGKELGVQARYQLEDLLEKEVDCMEKIREGFRMVPFEVLFNQIDFFNNGYVDASSLAQFLLHYGGKGEGMGKVGNHVEVLCGQVIKYLKGSATGEKIFYADFASILEDHDASQNPQQAPMIPNHSLSLSRSYGHIARVSELQMLHSRNKRPKPLPDIQSPNPSLPLPEQVSNIHTYTRSFGSNVYRLEAEQNGSRSGESMLVKGKLNHEDIDRISKMMMSHGDGLTYEEKICGNHWRNAKYMDKIKMDSNLSHFRASNNLTLPEKDSGQHIYTRKSKQLYKQSFHPLREDQKQSLKPSEILYQLRYIGQLYDRHRKELEAFLSENPAFSMINGFNVIDLQDRGIFSLKELKEFLIDAEIELGEEKIGNFYGCLSGKLGKKEVQEPDGVSYSRFVIKIFKLRAIEDLYRSCRKRRPLVTQQWPEAQKKNYCRFIRSIISIFHQIINSKKTLRKMLRLSDQLSPNQQLELELREKMQQIFKENDIHYQKFKQILGKSSETMAMEIYGEQSILEPAAFLSFLINKT